VLLAAGACRGDDGNGSGQAAAADAEGLPFVTATTVSTPPEPRADIAGIAAGSALVGGSLTQIRSDLDGIAATGVRWLRVDFDWSFVQRDSPDMWDWSRVDRVVREALARGLSVVGLLAYTPGWARPPGTSDKHPPVDPDRFATFAGAAVRRYAGAGVHSWEIWNEPNISAFWEPRPDPEGYAALVVKAADAIRSAAAGSTVLAGGLAPGNDLADGSQLRDTTFLGRVYAAGAGNAFDAVAVHPYSFPALPEAATDGFGVNGVRAMHVLMKAQGDGGKEIWATEMGAPTGGPGSVAPEAQARTVTEAFAAWVRLRWAGPMLWFSYRDEGPDPNSTAQTFGLVDYEGTPKPALAAFGEAVAALPHTAGR
jgi:hypothetical protein